MARPKKIALAAPPTPVHLIDVTDVMGELDRQITKTLKQLGRLVKPDLAGILQIAEEVERLARARETYRVFGYRMTKLSKGSEVA